MDPIAIQSLNIPVLVLVGELFPTHLIEISRELERLLPNSQMVTLENSSHGLYFEQPEAADKAMMEFLERN
ncbi:alpha/beta fold hydrolase [Kriegella aquimaris]|uniref:alpha/beta fold hydrolase n=1 Tax=Kriegella aquimaris TaxID=192904 RepID=UPI0015A3A087|nr:alpha/beta hydrolase [Kriegella aquimaris]